MSRPRFPSLWEKCEGELLAKIRGERATPDDYRSFNEIVLFKLWLSRCGDAIMICADCGKETTVLAQGRCMVCNERRRTSNLPECDATQGGEKLLAFLQKLCNNDNDGIIILPSDRRLIVMPMRS